MINQYQKVSSSFNQDNKDNKFQQILEKASNKKGQKLNTMQWY